MKRNSLGLHLDNRGKDKEVAAAVSKVRGVREAHLVTGPYDIIAVVEVPDMKALDEIVWSKVRTIDGVTKSLTSVVTE